MGTVFAIVNQKGGVAKTSTVSAMAAGLRRLYKKTVLCVDLDPQSNLTYASGTEDFPCTLLEVLQKKVSARDAIRDDLICGSPFLASADLMFTGIGKEYLLKEALAKVREDYDFVLLDCPPSLGILSVNALTACDRVIVPAQPDMFSVQAILQVSETVSAVKQYTNPGIALDGILMTRFNGRTVISREVLAMMQDTARSIGTRVFETVIRECSAVKEAVALRTDIFSYAPKSNAAADYTDFLKELMGGN